MDIETSLLREKFDIVEKNAGHGGKAFNISCPSTRMVIKLEAGETTTETYVVRTNAMHSCIRMASQIINEFDKLGPIMPRDPPLKWQTLWDGALSSYDRSYNPNKWGSVHHNGKVVFSHGNYHPFLDVIEKFDYLDKGKYENSIAKAEEAFKKSGKDVNIEYDTNVALVASLDSTGGRCSMILRGPTQTTTFNYTLRKREDGDSINTAQILNSTADFLEGAHLCYLVGVNQEKIDHGLIEQHSHEDIETQSAKKRITRLDAQINSMENRYTVRYRPERPDFNHLINLAEEFAQETLFGDGEDDGG